MAQASAVKMQDQEQKQDSNKAATSFVIPEFLKTEDGKAVRARYTTAGGQVKMTDAIEGVKVVESVEAAADVLKKRDSRVERLRNDTDDNVWGAIGLIVLRYGQQIAQKVTEKDAKKRRAAVYKNLLNGVYQIKGVTKREDQKAIAMRDPYMTQCVRTFAAAIASGVDISLGDGLIYPKTALERIAFKTTAEATRSAKAIQFAKLLNSVRNMEAKQVESFYAEASESWQNFASSFTDDGKWIPKTTQVDQSTVTNDAVVVPLPQDLNERLQRLFALEAKAA